MIARILWIADGHARRPSLIMPALALLGEDGKLEQSSEPFRRWYADKEELCKQSP